MHDNRVHLVTEKYFLKTENLFARNGIYIYIYIDIHVRVCMYILKYHIVLITIFILRYVNHSVINSEMTFIRIFRYLSRTLFRSFIGQLLQI